MSGDGTAAMIKALHRAQRRVVAIGKHSSNKQQGYDYTSSEDMVGICGMALSEEGLIVRRTAYTVGEWTEQSLRTRNGEATYIVAAVSMRFLIAHVDGGSMTDEAMFPAVQSGGRPADKAVAAALTASLGFYLRDLLLVSRGHDKYDIEARPEPDGDDAKRQGQPPAQAKRGPSQAAPRQAAQTAAEGDPWPDFAAAVKARIGVDPDDVRRWAVQSLKGPDPKGATRDGLRSLFTVLEGAQADFRAWVEANPATPEWVPASAADLYQLAVERGARFDGLEKSTADKSALQAVIEFLGRTVDEYVAWRTVSKAKPLDTSNAWNVGGALYKFVAGESVDFEAWCKTRKEA